MYTLVRVLARILRMSVQNSNLKISDDCAHPDLATQLILTKKLHLIAYCVKKGNLHSRHFSRQ